MFALIDHTLFLTGELLTGGWDVSAAPERRRCTRPGWKMVQDAADLGGVSYAMPCCAMLCQLCCGDGCVFHTPGASFLFLESACCLTALHVPGEHHSFSWYSVIRVASCPKTAVIYDRRQGKKRCEKTGTCST